MPTHCCVFNCKTWQGKENGVGFYRFPVVSKRSKNQELNALLEERKLAWVKAIYRKNFTPRMIKNARVCSKHFISGKSATAKDKLNPDWVPSVNLGYENQRSSHTKNKVKRYNRTLKRQQQKQVLSEIVYKHENETFEANIEPEPEISADKGTQTERKL